MHDAIVILFWYMEVLEAALNKIDTMLGTGIYGDRPCPHNVKPILEHYGICNHTVSKDILSAVRTKIYDRHMKIQTLINMVMAIAISKNHLMFDDIYEITNEFREPFVGEAWVWKGNEFYYEPITTFAWVSGTSLNGTLDLAEAEAAVKKVRGYLYRHRKTTLTDSAIHHLLVHTAP